MSAFTVLFNPAAASVLPAVAGDDHVLDANSVIWSTAVVSRIVLAPLAGVLVVTAGAGPAFAVNAVSFLVSAALLARIQVSHHPPPPGRRHLADIADGFAYLRASRFLTTLAAVQGLAALSAGATSALLVVLAERHLHLGAGRFGLLLAATGVGASAGPLLLRHLTRNVSRPALVGSGATGSRPSLTSRRRGTPAFIGADRRRVWSAEVTPSLWTTKTGR